MNGQVARVEEGLTTAATQLAKQLSELDFSVTSFCDVRAVCKFKRSSISSIS